MNVYLLLLFNHIKEILKFKIQIIFEDVPVLHVTLELRLSCWSNLQYSATPIIGALSHHILFCCH